MWKNISFKNRDDEACKRNTWKHNMSQISKKPMHLQQPMSVQPPKLRCPCCGNRFRWKPGLGNTDQVVHGSS